KAGEYNQASVRLHELERDAQVNREMFQAFLARAKETAAQSGAELPDSRIVSNATTPPAPSYPPRLLFAGLGLFGSLGIGIALAFLFDAFGSGLRTVEEVQDKLGLRTMIPMPNVTDKKWPPFVNAPPIGDLRWLHAPKVEEESQTDRSAMDSARSARRLASIALDQPDSGFAEGIRTLQFSV